MIGDAAAVADHVRSLRYQVVTTGRRQEFDARGAVHAIRA
jgi:hypothetical protein